MLDFYVQKLAQYQMACYFCGELISLKNVNGLCRTNSKYWEDSRCRSALPNYQASAGIHRTETGQGEFRDE